MKIKVFALTQEEMTGQGLFFREVREIDSDDTLHEMYRLIGCDLVDCRDFFYKGERFTLWFDEEYLLSGKPLVGTFLLEYPNGYKDIICGGWVITKIDEEGETIGITEKEIKEMWEYTDINGIKLGVEIGRRRKAAERDVCAD